MPFIKNIKLVDSVAEKIAVTRHSNGTDYWIVTHKFFSNEFWALELSANGIIDTVISAIGSSNTGYIGGSQGQLKISPNGQRLAIAASNGLDLLEAFDFSNSTGIISNYLPLYKPNNDKASIYGVEFSPDNSKLYASGMSSMGTLYSFLAQYDLNAGGGVLSSINSSMSEIYHHTSGIIGGAGLQLAPNNKIYWVSLSNPGTLATLNNPNIFGTGCNFQDQNVSLGGKQGSYSVPSFISAYDYSNKLSQCSQTVISENSISNNISLYPNPASSTLTIETTDKANQNNFQFFDLLGKKIEMSFSEAAQGRWICNLESLANGIYVLRINASKGTKSFRVVKQD